jgi:MFS transporter, SP family, sugar:H+ symporter
MLLLSYILQAFFMYLLAGLGQINGKTSSESNMIVAAFMLFSFFYNVSITFLQFELSAC